MCITNGEASTVRSGAQGVEEDDAAVATGQDAISDAVDLRAVEEARPEKSELIGREVNAIGVRADVRIVPEAKPVVGTVIRRSLGTVVLHRLLVDRPTAHRVHSVCHREGQLVVAMEYC